MATYPSRYRLPVGYSTEIGRIIARWAFLEWRLKQIGYLLVNPNPKIGRLAVREPRISDHVTMIEDLVKLKRIIIKTDLKRLREGLVNLERSRDALAHGVWGKHPTSKTPVLQILKGKWAHPAKPKTKRIVDPEAISVTINNLRDITRSIEGGVKIILALEAEIRSRLSP